jgi:hypothetical protein
VGTPLDHTASGLIWYTTRCGAELTSVAEVSNAVLSEGVPLVLTSNAEGHTWASTCSRVRCQAEAAAEWMSQLAGCGPTAYETLALVS